MSKQNIYDNETFFEGYKRLRDNPLNANDLFEIPALLSLMPDLNGKSVLDLGCGFGDHCMKYAEMGAERITGVDISEKMLAVAREKNSAPKIEYIRMPIEEISQLRNRYDIVISSLAFHYVEDLGAVLRSIHSLLCDGGILVFSQENPLVTCHSSGERWTRDASGNKLYVNLSDYGIEGERRTKWFVEGVQIYHRMFSTIAELLIDSGFSIERMIEPLPDEELLKSFPEYRDLFHKPDFLIIRAGKVTRV